MCKIWRIKKYSRKSVTVMVHGVHNNSMKHAKCSAPGNFHGLKEAIMKICSKSRALCSIQLLPRDVLKRYMAWGKARSPYSACGDSDSPLMLKLLLFLEMALCSGWCGLSMTDTTQFSLHPSATVVKQSSSIQTGACVPHEFVQACCVLEVAPSTLLRVWGGICWYLCRSFLQML